MSRSTEGNTFPQVISRLLLLLLVCLPSIPGSDLGGSDSYHNKPPQRSWSSRVVTTKLGLVRGFITVPRGFDGVEVFLGLPYAQAPLGSLRLMPPVSGSPWSGTRMNDQPGPVCPQVFPLPSIRTRTAFSGSEDDGRGGGESEDGESMDGVGTSESGDLHGEGEEWGLNETEILKNMPRGRMIQLKRLAPLLQNQSEDCLYLNIYVPLADLLEFDGSKYQLHVVVNDPAGLNSPTSQIPTLPSPNSEHQVAAGSGNHYWSSPPLSQVDVPPPVRTQAGNAEIAATRIRGVTLEDIYLCQVVSEGKVDRPVPCLIFIHGDDFSYGGGHPYDPTMLVSQGNIIVITFNFRLGILGFLNSNSDGYFKSPANFALLDQVAALHFVQENIAAFGGDRGNVTLMGHGKGAMFASFLMISNALPSSEHRVTEALFHRVILMSGSALSPFTVGLSYGKDLGKKFAGRFKCPTEPPSNMLQCLRQLPLQYFLDSDLWNYFGPSDDGIVIESGIRENVLRDRISRFPMMFGVTKAELLPTLNEHDAVYGLETEKRREVLKQYIDGFYSSGYRTEILAAAIHEYTDWERPVQHPISVRDETLDALADAQIVSPLVKLGELHSQGSSRTYFYVFEYQSKVSDYVQRLGCVHGEDLHYVFGVPLFLSSANAEHPEWDDPHQNNAGVGGGDAGKLGVFSGNFTRNEVQLSHTVLHYWVNFIKTGNPNAEPTSTPSSEGSPSSSSSQGSSGGGVSLGGSTGENRFPHQDKSSSSSVMSVKPKLIEWPPYDSLFKKYLSIEAKPRIRNHYRAHRLSFWLHLVPELMRNGGGGGISMFQNRPEGHVINSSNSTVQHPPSIQLVGPPYWEQHPFYYSSGNYSSYPGGDISGPLGSRPHHRFHNDHSNGIGGGDPGGFQIYSTALSVTIAVGCSFLILNILVFVAFYYFRDKRRAARHSRGGESEPYRNHPGPISASGDGLDHPTSYPTSADLQLSVDPTTTKGQSASTYSSADTMVLPSIHNTPVRLQENGQIPNFHQQQRHHHQNQHQMLPMPNICGDLPISANLQQLLAESAANSGGGRTSSPYQHANPSQNQAPTFMLGGASTSTSTSTLPSNKRQGQRSSSSGGSSTLGGHSFELSMPDAILAAAMMLNYRQNNSSQVSSSGGGSDFFLGTGHKSSSAAGKRPALNMKEQLLLSAGISDAATSAVGFTSAPGPGSGGNGGRTGVIVGNLPGSRGSVPYNNNATGGGGGESGCGNVIQFDFENASKSVPRPPKRQTPSVKFSPDTFISPDGSICSGPNANVNTSPVVVTAPNSAPILTANATPTSTSSSVSSISTNSANNPSQLKSSLKKHSNYSPAQDQLNV